MGAILGEGDDSGDQACALTLSGTALPLLPHDPIRWSSWLQGMNFGQASAWGGTSSGLNVTVRGQWCSVMERTHTEIVCEVHSPYPVDGQQQDAHLARVDITSVYNGGLPYLRGEWDIDMGGAPPLLTAVLCPIENNIASCSTAGFLLTIKGSGFGTDPNAVTVDVEVSTGHQTQQQGLNRPTAHSCEYWYCMRQLIVGVNNVCRGLPARMSRSRGRC